MSTEPSGFAFIALLRDDLEARGLAGLLEGVARSGATTDSVFLVPDVRGLDFFAASSRQREIDRWWGRHVPASSVPVYLVAHEEGLAGWLAGLDGVALVAAPAHLGAVYPSAIVVDAEAENAPLALAEAAIVQFGVPGDQAHPFHADVFDRRDAAMVSGLRAQPTTLPGARPEFPPLLHVEGVRTPALPARTHPAEPGRETSTSLDPMELLAADGARAPRQVPEPGLSRQLPPPSTARARLRRRLPSLAMRANSDTVGDAELAALLVARAPTVVVIGSRKGGVGKTSHAAGMAIVAGTVLDSVGHCAAILDANVANPDAWGQLNLPDGAATVRGVVSALVAGVDPPAPRHAASPALACYPERRDGVEYSRTDIRRLADYVRSRYAFTVVDMSNRLPDPTGGPEAAVAAYWLDEADALVLPTGSSRQDFNGVLDYLDVAGLPPTVVPYIASSARRNRRHPTTRHYLDTIRPRVHGLVQIPDEADSVRFAGLEGAAVQDVSPRMRSAYRQLTVAVARLPRGARA